MEHFLDLWNEWASCKLPDPPDKKLKENLLKDIPKVKWPAPPGPQAEEIKRKAEKEIGKIPGSLPGGGPEGPPGSGPGNRNGGRSEERGGFRQGFVISGGLAFSSPSLKSLNEYVDYLNNTWLGDVPSFGGEFGYRFSLGWQFTPVFEAGTFFERTSGEVKGMFSAFESLYASRHALSAVGIYVGARSEPFLSVVRLTGRAEAGYYKATYFEIERILDELVIPTEGSDHTIGWSTSAGLDVSLSGGLSLTMTGGYQSAVLNDFGATFFMPGPPPVVIEFSGLVARAGLSVPVLSWPGVV